MLLDLKACDRTDGGSMAAAVYHDHGLVWRVRALKSMNMGAVSRGHDPRSAVTSRTAPTCFSAALLTPTRVRSLPTLTADRSWFGRCVRSGGLAAAHS
jgi:hypothetical protein